jgi:hypothetical protein
MNPISKYEKMFEKLGVLLLCLAVPALAWGQQKPSKAPAPKAPAAHASAPSHAAAPQHSAPASHQGAPSGHTASAGHTAPTGHTATAAGGHANTAGRPGTAGHTTATGRTAATGNAGTAGRSAASGHPAATAHTSPTGRTAGGTNAKPAGGMNANKGAAGRGPAGATAKAPHTPPGRQVSLKGGGSAHIRPNGQIRSVNRNGMHIDRGVHGERRVVSTRNGVRVVSAGRRGGYVQRAYVTRGGRSYYSRTYYYHGGYRAGVYRGYNYGGHPYYGYYPAYYYHPAYYGWAYNPWPAPVAYGWGWGGAPWYGYYGGYFEPYPVYPSAAFWLTDYLVAASLRAAYEAQAASAEGLLHSDAGDGTLVASLLPLAAAGAETAKLSPEVKKELAEEVKVLLAAEQAESGKGKSTSEGQPAASKDEAPPALDPNFRSFVVSSDLTLVVDGNECALSDGDVITRTTETPDDDQNVNVKVVSSKKSDCEVGAEGSLAVDDLQEMYNHFREQLKDGMGELAKKQGTGGLPKAPDTTTTAGDVPPPEPDKTAEKALKEQQSAADQTESEVKQEAGSGSGGGQ